MNIDGSSGSEADRIESLTQSEDAARAAQEHEEIKMEAARAWPGWTKLARRCILFQKTRSYRLVTDPETGQPFTNFGRWAEVALGKAKSSIWQAMRVVRKLGEEDVTDEELESMSKQNAEQLVRAKKRGRKLTPELKEKARKLSAREFRREVEPAQELSQVAVQDEPVDFVVTFTVGRDTKRKFDHAMELGRCMLRRGDNSQEPVIDLILSEFIDRHQKEGISAFNVAA